jgi:hypothetical protein
MTKIVSDFLGYRQLGEFKSEIFLNIADYPKQGMPLSKG